jgi:hypothetical protein
MVFAHVISSIDTYKNTISEKQLNAQFSLYNQLNKHTINKSSKKLSRLIVSL